MLRTNINNLNKQLRQLPFDHCYYALRALRAHALLQILKLFCDCLQRSRQTDINEQSRKTDLRMRKLRTPTPLDCYSLFLSQTDVSGTCQCWNCVGPFLPEITELFIVKLTLLSQPRNSLYVRSRSRPYIWMTGNTSITFPRVKVLFYLLSYLYFFGTPSSSKTYRDRL